MSLPFEGAEAPEVCARVIIACLKRLYTRSGRSIRTLNQAYSELPKFTRTLDSQDMMSLAISSLATYSMEGMKAEAWATHVIMASRCGYTFRRCFFFAYKATRHDPRVTNRGVISRSGSYAGETYHQTTIAEERNDEQSGIDNSGSGLDNGNAPEGSVLSPKVAERRIRTARAGRK